MPGPLWPKVPHTPGGSGAISVQDEGVALGAFTGFDFTGDGVTVTVGANGFVTVNIPTGAGGVQDVVENYGPGAGTVQGVAATPGWQVLEPGAFSFSNALSDPYTQAIFRVIALVSDASLTGRIRLFDVTDGVEVAASVLSTSSITDVVLSTADILASLIDGHLYQFQAEATGGVGDAGFIFVRSAVLICQV